MYIYSYVTFEDLVYLWQLQHLQLLEIRGYKIGKNIGVRIFKETTCVSFFPNKLKVVIKLRICYTLKAKTFVLAHSHQTF